MRKLVVAMVLLAVFGFAAPVAQADPILSWVELAFKSSADSSVVYDNFPWDPWVNPAGADLSGFNKDTGLGTIKFTFDTPGTHWVAGLFDYQFVDVASFNGLFDEWGGGALVLPGLSGTIDDPWDGSSYTQLSAFDDTHPFDGIPHLSAPDSMGNVAVGLGYNFVLNAGDAGKRVLFTVSESRAAANVISHIDNPSGRQVYFSLRTEDLGDGGPVIPEPGTLTLLGLGLAMGARRLRRRG